MSFRMRPSTRKLIRDITAEPGRSVVVVLAIALGLAGFSSVLCTYAILTRELDRGYLATNPAAATITADAIDTSLVAEAEGLEGVAQAEARRVVSGRVKAGPAEWRTLRLFVVPDFARVRVCRLVPQGGEWPPQAGEILLERDAMGVARAEVGGTITLRAGSHPERTLRVAGTVHDVGQAQARMENIVYGYIGAETLPLLGEEASFDQLLMTVTGDRTDKRHIESVATGVREWLEGKGHTVRGTEIPEPGKHPHAMIMGLLLAIIAAFGFLAVLLSGLLVVNLMTALMASQVRQVAVMQAIGGTRGQIARVYLAQAVVLGVAALAVSVPAGEIGARALCRYLAGFLNFDITSFRSPVWVYALETAAAVLVPLVAAARPVLRGTGVPVRVALADFGTGRRVFGTGRIDRALARVGGMPVGLRLALRNAFRRPGRLALTLVTLALAGVCFLSALNARASLVGTLDRMFASRTHDLSLTLGTMVRWEDVQRAIAATPGIASAEGWITTQATMPEIAGAEVVEGQPGGGGMHGGGGLHSGGSGGGLHGGGGDGGNLPRFPVVALPSSTRMLQLDIVEGRALQAGDERAVVVNSRLVAEHPEARVGSDITLEMGPSREKWRVVGVSWEPFSPAAAYVPLSVFEKAGHVGLTNSVRLVLENHDRASINAVREVLDAGLERNGIRAVGSMATGEGRYGFDQHFLMIYVFLLIMAGVLAGVGGLGLMTTMTLNVLERRRELGVMLAVGASPLVLRVLVVAEGVFVALGAFVLAALAAWPVGGAICSAAVFLAFRTRVGFAFDPVGPVVWLCVSVVLGAVASLAPAVRATRSSVREALAHE